MKVPDKELTNDMHFVADMMWLALLVVVYFMLGYWLLGLDIRNILSLRSRSVEMFDELWNA